MVVVQVVALVLHAVALVIPHAMDHQLRPVVPVALPVVRVVALAHVEAVVHHHVAVVAHQIVHQDALGPQNRLVVLLAQIRVAVDAQTVVQKIAATTVKRAVAPDVIMDAATVVREVAVQLV